jgi:hypothetical protein
VATAAHTACRIGGCPERVPPALQSESLCLDHFVDHTFSQAQSTLDLCRAGQPLDWAELEWLFTVAEFTVRMMAQNPGVLTAEHRDKTLELLLCLSNIREYLRHHSIAGARAS